MPSNEFADVAKNVAKKDKALFDTLIEFEQTRKMRTKERLNFTIDKSLASQFKRFCRENGYNMSAKIEQAIREILKKS